MCVLIFAVPCCDLAVIFALLPYRDLTVILSAYIFGLLGKHPDSVATRVETTRLETCLSAVTGVVTAPLVTEVSVRTAGRTNLCVPASMG